MPKNTSWAASFLLRQMFSRAFGCLSAAITSSTAPADSSRTVVSQPESIPVRVKRNCPTVPEKPQQMPAIRASRIPRSVLFFTKMPPFLSKSSAKP